MKTDFSFSDEAFRSLLSDVDALPAPTPAEVATLLSCIDHTTLSGTDSARSVRQFCLALLDLSARHPSLPTVASVCVYPLYVPLCREVLSSSPVRVAAVAGGFPDGQLPLQLKVDEVRRVVADGADEVDFVICRGNVLDSMPHAVFDEVTAVREACGNATLKVILETGQLATPERIYDASMQAMQAGADFIKTSTGKSAVGATPEAAFVMLSAISDFYKISKKKVGFKVAGGVSSLSDALRYYCFAQKLLNTESISNQFFRIGTSKLLPEIVKFLTS